MGVVANGSMFDRVKLPKSFLAINVSDTHVSDASSTVSGGKND